MLVADCENLLAASRKSRLARVIGISTLSVGVGALI